MLPNNLGCLRKAEECFHLWTLWKNPEAQKMWGTLKVSYGQIVKVENSFCCCPLFCWVLSHMKESILARTTLEALVNMKGFEI
jgi:hypothetical protein